MTSVAEVMTRDVATISPEQSIQQAAQLMETLDVGSLPVCDGELLVGILTDRDIAIRAVSAGKSPDTPVAGIASGPVTWCFEDDDIEDVRQKMADIQIRRVPVLDREKHLVGILALGDLATSADGGMSSALSAVSTPSRPDR